MEQAQNREVALRLTGIKKRYKLGQIGGGTLTADLQSWWARVRGKEDPNVMIGTDQRLVGKEFMALNGIDLTVYKGEALGIIGGNGAGKSTMLKLLCRVTAPTEGEIDLYGRIASMLEVGTGFNGEMTGRENIYMNGAILGMSKAEIDEKMEAIIDFSEVRDFIDTPVKRYSSGMFVKLAFSVAAHLDVSHNMSTIRRLCDRCIVMDKGRIIFNGGVEEAIEIYLSNAHEQWSDNRTEFDLSQTDTRSPYTPGNVQITWLKLLDKESAMYTSGEKIRMQLRIRAKTAFSDLHLRLELRSRDETPVGTMPDVPLGAIQAETEQDYLVELDPICLTNGRYRLDMVLFEKDDCGNSFDQELLLPAFNFEVQQAEDIVWNQANWGHIRFPDAELVRCTREGMPL